MEAFVNYIKANAKTYKALKDKNWQKFAEYYNGRDYKKNQYD